MRLCSSIGHDRERSADELECWHRAKANVANRIREAKLGLGLDNLPCRGFHANWAYLLCTLLAYDLLVWLKLLALPAGERGSDAKRLRFRFIAVAGTVGRSGRRLLLRLQAGYRSSPTSSARSSACVRSPGRPPDPPLVPGPTSIGRLLAQRPLDRSPKTRCATHPIQLATRPRLAFTPMPEQCTDGGLSPLAQDLGSYPTRIVPAREAPAFAAGSADRRGT